MFDSDCLFDLHHERGNEAVAERGLLQQYFRPDLAHIIIMAPFFLIFDLARDCTIGGAKNDQAVGNNKQFTRP